MAAAVVRKSSNQATTKATETANIGASTLDTVTPETEEERAQWISVHRRGSCIC